MNRSSSKLSAALLASAFLFGAFAVTVPTAPAWAQKQKGPSISAGIAKQVIAAQQALQAKNYPEVLAKLKETEGAKKSPYDEFIINFFSAQAYAGLQDAPNAAKSLKAALDSGGATPEDVPGLRVNLVQFASAAKDWATAVSTGKEMIAAGDKDPEHWNLVTQALWQQGNYAETLDMAKKTIALAREQNARPAEPTVVYWLLSANKLQDNGAYIDGLEQGLLYYPKREYWIDMLTFIQKKPGFSKTLALDVYRLQAATGVMEKSGEFMEMADIALNRDALPGEALAVLKDGGAKGALSASGPDGARMKQLQDAASKAAAEDQKGLAGSEKEAAAKPEALFKVGEAYASYGQYDKGIGIMQQAISKGVKEANQAKLRVAEWQIKAGKKTEAMDTLKTVSGADGSADVAKLWMIHLNSAA